MKKMKHNEINQNAIGIKKSSLWMLEQVQYDTPAQSSSDPTGESIKQQCRIAESGRSPFSVSLGRSETKTRGSIIAESGRSMVEMLGTLAIIGVLSIGGIAGYSYGMDKYRANETINDMNLRGIDLIRQVVMGQSLSLSEWPKKSKAGYDISDPSLIEGEAYISVSSVPKRVCEMIYQALQNNPTTDIEINEATNGDASDCNKDEDNTIGFFFNQNTNTSDNKETTTTTENLVCCWTDWINNSHPSDNSEGGDIETYSGYCTAEYVQEIECRAATEPFLSWETLGQKAQCNTEVGFMCKNEDQFGNELFGLCYDYEIRVNCCMPREDGKCPNNSGNSSEETTTTTTPPPPPPETTTTTIPEANPGYLPIIEEKIAELKAENPHCEAPYFDGNWTVYYYAGPFCEFKSCEWLYGNEWNCSN